MKSLCCNSPVIYKEQNEGKHVWCKCVKCGHKCIQMPDNYKNKVAKYRAES